MSLIFFFFFFLFLSLAAICSAERNHFSNFGSGSSKEHFCDFFLEIWPLAYEEMSFKIYFYFQLRRPFYLAERNHFSNFGRR